MAPATTSLTISTPSFRTTIPRDDASFRPCGRQGPRSVLSMSLMRSVITLYNKASLAPLQNDDFSTGYTSHHWYLQVPPRSPMEPSGSICTTLNTKPPK